MIEKIKQLYKEQQMLFGIRSDDYSQGVLDGIDMVLKLVESNIEDELFKAYKSGWRKSKVYAKKTNFHGLNSSQIEEYFDKWFESL